MATAASTADPPRRSTAIPASAANGLAAATNGPRAASLLTGADVGTAATAPPFGAVPVWHPARITGTSRAASRR